MVLLKNLIIVTFIAFTIRDALSSSPDSIQIPSLFFHDHITTTAAIDTSFKKSEGIQLDGIIWQNSDKWTIWINGEKITNQQHHPLYDIMLVTEHMVQIRLSNGEVISLKPGHKN
ncbi:MAG: hypothetical protein J0G29_00845 [Alphaproteobacteria bacterium]|nr:hypothetical protein [Alphaproteobacteria bacterium]OJV45671.1 MAG: hypothetical protein BGO28_02290 [Alphaproteobacteria bacterium 43-37]